MKLNDKNVSLTIFLSAVLVLSMILSFRIEKAGYTVAGEDSYMYMLQDLGYNPYYHIINMIDGNTLLMLNSIISVVNLMFFYFLLRKKRCSIEMAFITCVIIILSPVFIYSAFFVHFYALAIFLDLAAFLLLLNNGKIRVLSLPLFLAASFFDFINSVVIITMLLFLIGRDVKDKILYYCLFVVFLISYLNYNMIEKGLMMYHSVWNMMLSDLGSVNGYGLFTLMLMALGAYLLWIKYNYEKFWFLFAAVGLAIAIYYSELNMYANYMVCFVAAIGFIEIFRSRWENNFLKRATIMLIVCGLLFSSISYINRITDMLPDRDTVEALEWLKGQDDGVVLSHFTRGMWIKYYAQKQPFVSSLSSMKDNAAAEEIFYSRNLKNTTEMLDSNGIRWLYIDAEMKQGLVWEKQEQGLLFLFRNKENFRKAYENKNAEMWEFLKDE